MSDCPFCNSPIHLICYFCWGRPSFYYGLNQRFMAVRFDIYKDYEDDKSYYIIYYFFDSKTIDINYSPDYIGQRFKFLIKGFNLPEFSLVNIKNAFEQIINNKLFL